MATATPYETIDAQEVRSAAEKSYSLDLRATKQRFRDTSALPIHVTNDVEIQYRRLRMMARVFPGMVFSVGQVLADFCTVCADCTTPELNDAPQILTEATASSQTERLYRQLFDENLPLSWYGSHEDFAGVGPDPVPSP